VAERAGRDHAKRDIDGETTTLAAVSLSLKNPEGDDGIVARLREAHVVDGDYFFLGGHKGMYYFVPYRSLTSLEAVETPRVIVIQRDLVATLRMKE
jgi:hypothetical protein